VALEAKTDEALRALMAGVEQDRLGAAERARLVAADQRTDRLERIRDLVLEAADRDLRDGDHFERLDVEEDFYSDPERPLRDTVEHLCRYFRLAPDWSRWDGEGWIKEEGAPKRTRYSIFNQPSAAPLLDDEDDSDESQAEPRPGPPQNGHRLE
jgi:hypothetical protein